MVWTVLIVIVVISIIDYSLLVMSDDDDIFAEDEDLDAPWKEESDVEENQRWSIYRGTTCERIKKLHEM